MSTTIDISELRVGYVLGAPIYDDKNVKLLGQGVTIAEKFISQLRRRGIRSVHVTEDDLAQLRGWKLSIDTSSDGSASGTKTSKCAMESRIDQARFRRYLAAIAHVGRLTRTNAGPLKRIRESAQQAAVALRAEHYAFSLTVPNSERISIFLSDANSAITNQKIRRQSFRLAGNRSLFALAMTSDSPIFVKNLAADTRFSKDMLEDLQVSSAVAVPLHRGVSRAGSLALLFQQPNELDSHDLAFVETIANIISVPPQADPNELNGESEDLGARSTSQRYDYPCWQGIAPLDGDQAPVRSAYQEVLCRDISIGGFSFYYPHRPEFTHLAVALGQPPHLKQMKATVVSCCGTEVDGRPCVMVGCRFAGPLAAS